MLGEKNINHTKFTVQTSVAWVTLRKNHRNNDYNRCIRENLVKQHVLVILSDNLGRVAMFFSQFNGVHLTEETKKTKRPKPSNSWTKTKPGVVATWRVSFRLTHVDAANTCGQSRWGSCFAQKHAWARVHSSSSRKEKQPFFLHNLIAVVPYLVLVANGQIRFLVEEEERRET